MIVTTVPMFGLYLSFLSHATREISLTVYILLKARGTQLGKNYHENATYLVPFVLAECLVCSYSIYIHRKEFHAFQKRKKLKNSNWKNALLARIGKSPSNGPYMSRIRC